MSGVRLTLQLDDKGLQRDLRARLEQLADKTAILKSIGEEMLPRINKRFQDEKDPEGKSWPALAPRTIEARLKKYGNAPLTILRMRGHLAGAINYQISGATLKIGTGSEVEDYAAIHQFGGEAGRGRKVKIPARPYLGFNEEDMRVIEAEIAAMILDR